MNDLPQQGVEAALAVAEAAGELAGLAPVEAVHRAPSGKRMASVGRYCDT